MGIAKGVKCLFTFMITLSHVISNLFIIVGPSEGGPADMAVA